MDDRLEEISRAARRRRLENLSCHALKAERDAFATFAEPTLAIVRDVVEYVDEAIGDEIFDHDNDTYAHKSDP